MAYLVALLAHPSSGAVLQGPANYQRKMAGRMLWPKPPPPSAQAIPTHPPDPVDDLNDYPLDSFLTLSLSASDAEGAEGYGTDKPTNNLDLLQQLLRLSPDPESGNKKIPRESSASSDVQILFRTTTEPSKPSGNGWNGADPCTHVFHSWLCNKKKLPPNKQPEASHFNENRLLPETTTTTTQAPTPKQSGWDGDPCSHPFHSWLCSNPPERSSVPDSSKKEESFFIPEVIVTEPPPTTWKPSPPPKSIQPAIPMKKGWQGDPCSHPFHSWLCNPAPQPRTPPPTTPAPFIPEPSNNVDDQFVPEPSVQPTTTTTTTTRKPPISILIRTIMPPKSGGWTEENSCLHPQHSWLCNPVVPKAKTEAPPPPSTTPRAFLPEASNNFFIPEIIPPSTTTTTTLSPPISTPEPKSGKWNGANPCFHPQHSWLCNRARKGRQSVDQLTTDDAELDVIQWDSQRLVRPGRSHSA